MKAAGRSGSPGAGCGFPSKTAALFLLVLFAFFGIEALLARFQAVFTALGAAGGSEPTN